MYEQNPDYNGQHFKVPRVYVIVLYVEPSGFTAPAFRRMEGAYYGLSTKNKKGSII